MKLKRHVLPAPPGCGTLVTIVIYCSVAVMAGRGCEVLRDLAREDARHETEWRQMTDCSCPRTEVDKIRCAVAIELARNAQH